MMKSKVVAAWLLSVLCIAICAMRANAASNVATELNVPSGQLLVDNAQIFSQAERAVLLDSLATFARTTSNAIMVVTVPSLQGYTAIEAAYEIGNSCGVGTKDHNNGIVVIVKPKTADSRGEMAIAVGYGLEGAIPDATCKMIVTREAIPSFKEGDYYSGVMNSINVLMPLARGEYSYSDYDDEDSDAGAVVVILIMIFLFIIVAGMMGDKDDNNNNVGGGRRTFGTPIIIPGGGMRNSGFGGGFSSGGFGGFGGGSFGGGGASGSW